MLGKCGEEGGSSGKTRTYNPPVNSYLSPTNDDCQRLRMVVYHCSFQGTCQVMARLRFCSACQPMPSLAHCF